MDALEVISHLDRLGCQVLLEGKNIRVIPPEGVKLTDELRQSIRSNKEELVSLLRKLEQAQVEQLLKERGWVAVYSEALGEAVLWCRDEKVIIPTRWRDAVRYTLAELEALSKLTSKEGLRLIHEAKREFAGKVIPGQDPSPGSKEGCCGN